MREIYAVTCALSECMLRSKSESYRDVINKGRVSSICAFNIGFETHPLAFPRGLVARISGFHPEGPGSIPGAGESFQFARSVEG